MSIKTLIGFAILSLSLLVATFQVGHAEEDATAASAAELQGTNVVIFVYQRIGDEGNKYISADLFKAHLDYLERNGFQVWSLQRIATRLRSGQPIPDKTVAITFDDTHPSIYSLAYPALKARGWPFTVFVAPDRVDQDPRDNMSWAQMRDMKKSGVTFANHSSNHLRMPRRHKDFTVRAWNQYLLDNVLNAQTRLQEELGSNTNEDPRLFSYPYGEYTADLMDILKSAGFIAFGQQPGAISQYHNLQSLPRFLIANNNTNMETFARKAGSVALNIKSVSPENPVTISERPIVAVTLRDNRERPQFLSCYTREGYRLNVTWHDRNHSGFNLQSSQDLPRGYTFYQCTGRYQKSERTFWFSQALLVMHNRSGTEQRGNEEEEKEGEITAPPNTAGSESGASGATTTGEGNAPADTAETPAVEAPASDTGTPAPADPVAPTAPTAPTQ